jgi:hypothetical protein
MAVLFITRPSPGTIPPGTTIAYQYYSKLFEGGRDAVRSILHETANFEVRRLLCLRTWAISIQKRSSM